MSHFPARRLIVKLVSIALITLGFAPLSYGGVVSTGQLIDVQTREAQIGEIAAFLDRQAVRDELLRFGVSPDAVTARLDNLTAEELSELQGTIDEQVAGGDVLGLIGAVFLVLLILELVGVTNIFNSF